mmetsp:Transcript_1853/g.4526  ORF Transcript_1853/g.4526 Transcript_1853/m.4526 type:complete len:211 (-) Transcript_1853:749-1381(-)
MPLTSMSSANPAGATRSSGVRYLAVSVASSPTCHLVLCALADTARGATMPSPSIAVRSLAVHVRHSTMLGCVRAVTVGRAIGPRSDRSLLPLARVEAAVPRKHFAHGGSEAVLSATRRLPRPATPPRASPHLSQRRQSRGHARPLLMSMAALSQRPRALLQLDEAPLLEAFIQAATSLPGRRLSQPAAATRGRDGRIPPALAPRLQVLLW